MEVLTRNNSQRQQGCDYHDSLHRRSATGGPSKILIQKSDKFNFMPMVFAQIGLMRDGTLLAEDSPDSLIRKFECDNLEDVFLMLSRRQEESKALGGDQRPAKTQSQYAHEYVPEIEILVRRIDNGKNSCGLTKKAFIL
jgi:hypothetical protein